jgi:hypothetical protein
MYRYSYVPTFVVWGGVGDYKLGERATSELGKTFDPARKENINTHQFFFNSEFWLVGAF